MGEFHYARYPEAEWEREILKMKAGGVEIVATYVFWIHHEEVEGQFDWSGQRDLRRFIELCGGTACMCGFGWGLGRMAKRATVACRIGCCVADRRAKTIPATSST